MDLGYYLSCSSFCGYHENFSLNNKDIQYALIVNPEKCLHNCSAKEQYIINGFNHSPNNDWVADAMASIIAHELNEILTDPLPTKNPAWQNPAKWENADMSAWTYGQLYVTNNNSVANVKIGERDYLIQQNWIYDEDGGHPGLSK